MKTNKAKSKKKVAAKKVAKKVAKKKVVKSIVTTNATVFVKALTQSPEPVSKVRARELTRREVHKDLRGERDPRKRNAMRRELSQALKQN